MAAGDCPSEPIGTEEPPRQKGRLFRRLGARASGKCSSWRGPWRAAAGWGYGAKQGTGGRDPHGGGKGSCCFLGPWQHCRCLLCLRSPSWAPTASIARGGLGTGQAEASGEKNSAGWALSQAELQPCSSPGPGSACGSRLKGEAALLSGSMVWGWRAVDFRDHLPLSCPPGSLSGGISPTCFS